MSVRLSLNYEDLRFIADSIAENIPSEDHRSDMEQGTAEKVNTALLRARLKEAGHGADN